MDKSQEMLDLIDSYVENHVLMCAAIKDTGEQSAESIGYIEKSIDLREKLLAIADRQDKLLETAKFYLDELVYNDYVRRDPTEIAEVKKLIAECEAPDNSEYFKHAKVLARKGVHPPPVYKPQKGEG